jgi:hypothetical protein
MQIQSRPGKVFRRPESTADTAFPDQTELSCHQGVPELYIAPSTAISSYISMAYESGNPLFIDLFEEDCDF